MAVSLAPVRTAADKRAFYAFAFRVYRNDPCWVPHLWPQRKEYLDGKAPFFKYGEGEFWLARRGNEIVGTIGTAVDHARNRHMGWRAGLFGFFEALPDDYEAASAMWDVACEQARRRGLNELQGPYNFSGSDDPGFLVQGFEYPPAILMGHTPPTYAEYAQQYGFQTLLEHVAYRFDLAQINYDIANAPQIVHAIAARARSRHGPDVVRPVRLNEWDQEVERLHGVYNRSLLVLPEFSPLDLVEFRALAGSLRPMIDPELALIAEVGGMTVGFALGLPNINEALIHAGGLRNPWGYARFMWARRRITSVSFKILAIDPDYWGYGLEAILFLEMGRAMIRRGYQWVDASLTSTNNPQTNKLATRLGAVVYRRHRQYRLLL